MLGFDYPVWLLIFITLGAFSLSGGLYFHTFKEKILKTYQKTLLFCLRFIGLFLLGILLLKPFSENFTSQQQQAQLLILQDNSLSIIANGDSISERQKLKNQYQDFFYLLGSKNIAYTHYSFGSDICPNQNYNFKEKSSNISKSLSSIIDLNTGNLIGGILLISDGIHNQGEHPSYFSKYIKTPIYTIGLGDTTSYKDILIQKTDINPISFTKQKIHLKLHIKALKAKSKKTKLKIVKDNKLLFEKIINFDKDKYFEKVEIFLPNMEVGIHRLNILIDPIEKEKNIYNNQKTVYVKVIDAKKKILILYEAPHPDIAAISGALRYHEVLEIEKVELKNLNTLKDNYDLIILHQIPSLGNNTKPLTRFLSKQNTATWFIVSEKTNIKALNQVSENVKFAKKLNISEWCESSINTNFNPFIISSEHHNFIDKCPPLSAPFLKTKFTGETDILSYKKIKQVTTGQALFFFSNNNDFRSAYTLGEGIWKWKTHDYRENGSDYLFRDIVYKTVTYLTAPIHQSGLVTDIKNTYIENEDIKISANYYKDVNEVTNQYSLNIEYWKNKNSKMRKVFSPDKSGKYLCNLGLLEAGKYQYKINSKNLTSINKKGSFIVEKIKLESSSLIARHDILKNISQNTNGFFLERDKWFSIVDSISKLDNFKPQSYSSSKNTYWIEYLWLMLLIFICLASEWFLRKYWSVL